MLSGKGWVSHSQDILENDDIKLDWLFKSSLISDLANVSVPFHSYGIK